MIGSVNAYRRQRWPQAYLRGALDLTTTSFRLLRHGHPHRRRASMRRRRQRRAPEDTVTHGTAGHLLLGKTGKHMLGMSLSGRDLKSIVDQSRRGDILHRNPYGLE